jgi:hypothetical protein
MIIMLEHLRHFRKLQIKFYGMKTTHILVHWNSLEDKTHNNFGNSNNRLATKTWLTWPCNLKCTNLRINLKYG